VKDTILVIAITLGLLIGLEGAARIWYFFRAPRAPVVAETNNPMPPEDLDAKFDSHDLNAFTADTQHVPHEFAWHPYVYWRRPVHDVPTIHVDEQGIRRTVQPFGESAKTQVFLFGGSTMWGTGVRDENTVASQLARRLAELGYRDFHITNFGESAYVITQELLALMLELRRGHVPQIAIFYDGINEVASSVINQKAGDTQHEHEIGFLRHATPLDMEKLPIVAVILAKSALIKAVEGIAAKLGFRHREVAAQADKAVPADPAALAEATVATYWGAVDLIRALADRYGFEAYFYWQPSVFAKAPASPREQEMMKNATGDDFWKQYPEVWGRTLAAIRKSPHPRGFIDISTVLDGHPENLYWDIFHLTEKGNHQIALRLAEDLAHRSKRLAR
jgi:lysophospholipase L1-like esterase